MAKKPLPTPEELRQLLRYEPETGKLYWLLRAGETRGVKAFNSNYAGKEAFTCRMGEKHLQGRIHDRGFLAHRVIWAIVYGQWPTGEIDHINGDPVDNRIENLRDIPKPENQRNMKCPSTNSSGVCGVSWRPQRGKWRARIWHNGREVSLGHYEKIEDAAAAREAALVRYGYHRNHGRTKPVQNENIS